MGIYLFPSTRTGFEESSFSFFIKIRAPFGRSDEGAANHLTACWTGPKVLRVRCRIILRLFRKATSIPEMIITDRWNTMGNAVGQAAYVPTPSGRLYKGQPPC